MKKFSIILLILTVAILSIFGQCNPNPATPTFSPAAGAVTSGQEITINCATADVEIRYTTGDGSQDAPTATTGTVYSATAKPTVTEPVTFKAISVLNGLVSDVATAAYTIDTTEPFSSEDFEDITDWHVTDCIYLAATDFSWTNHVYDTTYNNTGWCEATNDDYVNDTRFESLKKLNLVGATAASLSFEANMSYTWSVTQGNGGTNVTEGGHDLNLMVSTDNGANWTRIWHENDYGVFTNWVWFTATVDLAAYLGQNIMIAFHNIGEDGAEVNIDNVTLTVTN